MKYIFTKGQKRMQQNLLIQLWRFVVLSLKFMKLTQTDFSQPANAGKPASSGHQSATDQAPDIKLVYKGDSPATAQEKVSQPNSSIAQKAR